MISELLMSKRKQRRKKRNDFDTFILDRGNESPSSRVKLNDDAAQDSLEVNGTDPNAQAELLRNLDDNSAPRSLILRQFDFTTPEHIDLLIALKANANVVRIEFVQCEFKSPAAQNEMAALIEQGGRFKRLQVQTQDTAEMDIFLALLNKEATSIKHLILSHSRIEQAQVDTLVQVLTINKSLETIDLSGCNLTDEQKQQLLDALKGKTITPIFTEELPQKIEAEADKNESPRPVVEEYTLLPPIEPKTLKALQEEIPLSSEKQFKEPEERIHIPATDTDLPPEEAPPSNFTANQMLGGVAAALGAFAVLGPAVTLGLLGAGAASLASAALNPDSPDAAEPVDNDVDAAPIAAQAPQETQDIFTTMKSGASRLLQTGASWASSYLWGNSAEAPPSPAPNQSSVIDMASEANTPPIAGVNADSSAPAATTPGPHATKVASGRNSPRQNNILQ
jgi:hypothetical protein